MHNVACVLDDVIKRPFCRQIRYGDELDFASPRFWDRGLDSLALGFFADDTTHAVAVFEGLVSGAEA